MYGNNPTLADITVEQYSAMQLAIYTQEHKGQLIGRVTPANLDFSKCCPKSYELLFSMGILRWRDNQHYILTNIGLGLMEQVIGKIAIV